MQYYLETNSLRQVIPYLNNAKLTSNAFTSILSIIEITSGIINQASFNTRQKILSKILNSKINICTNLSEMLYYKAFGFRVNDDQISNGIRRILSIVIDSDSYNEYINNIKESADFQHFRFLRQYDRNGSSFFNSAFLDTINNIRSEYNFKDLISDYYNLWGTDQSSESGDLFNEIIHHFSSRLFKYRNEIDPNDGRTLSEIVDAYDHSIDFFIIISSLYSFQHISFGNVPGKNDYFDLNHLIYLDTNLKKIVTNDMLFHKLMKERFSDHILSTNEFLQSIGLDNT